MILPGTPAITDSEGTFLVTKAPAAINESLSIVNPGRIIAPVAITAKELIVTPIRDSEGGVGSFVSTTYGKIQTKSCITDF